MDRHRPREPAGHPQRRPHPTGDHCRRLVAVTVAAPPTRDDGDDAARRRRRHRDHPSGRVVERRVPVMTAAVVDDRVPVPAGRGRWRVTLHDRQFVAGFDNSQSTMIVELTQARSRKLTRELDKAAQFDFTINATSEQAPPIVELATDILVWRWDGRSGRDVLMFRGVVDHTEDQVTEQSSVVTVT